jgi:hypothetical protein
MSWSELLPSGTGTPPALPLRHLILAALAEAAITRREGEGFCGDCAPGRPCPDRRKDLSLATQYEAAYMRVRGIGSDGATLTLTGGLVP